MKNMNLIRARNAKMDEFYTRIEDIEAELRHYPGAFRGKVVYSNCDDWRRSQFVRFFHDRFHELGLKLYMATCHVPQDIFSTERAQWYEYDGVVERHGDLEGDGDFRSPECIEYLKRCDVVVTNPPFSLFREFVALMDRF